MNEQYIDTIHRFLNGTMPSAEREAFEAELQSNPALRQDVELERTLLAGLEHAGQLKARRAIGPVHQKLREEGFFERDATGFFSIFSFNTSTAVLVKRVVAAAAACMILVAGYWFFINRNKPSDADALFARYYQPQDDLNRARGIIATLEYPGIAGLQTKSDTLRTALQLYEAGKYDEALLLLNNFWARYPENDTARYHIGVVQLHAERYAQAAESLLPVSRSDQSALKNDALWNLGLCYLKMENRLPDARSAFATLAADDNSPRRQAAKTILEQLPPDGQ